MDSAKTIYEKLSPFDATKNQETLKAALSDPEVLKSFTQSYQLPYAQIDVAEDGEKPFLLCRYNQVKDKHRSPWTNKLHPKEDETEAEMDEELRKIEININAVWDAYKALYYGGEAVGSVYIMPSDRGPFRAAFCLQKKTSTGSWNSFHFVNVEEPIQDKSNYTVESTVLVSLEPSSENASAALSTKIGARRFKETSETAKIRPYDVLASHIENIGAIIEANEIDIRSNIERVNLPKLHEILDNLRKEKAPPKQVNPLMTMIMDSDFIKKKLSQESMESGDVLPAQSMDSVESTDATQQPSRSPVTKSPRPVNPLMGDIMNSAVLKKKLSAPTDN